MTPTTDESRSALMSSAAALFRAFIARFVALTAGFALAAAILPGLVATAFTWKYGWGPALACGLVAAGVHALCALAVIPAMSMARAIGQTSAEKQLGRAIVERAIARAASKNARWGDLTSSAAITPEQASSLRAGFFAADEGPDAPPGLSARVFRGGRRWVGKLAYGLTLKAFQATRHSDGSIRVPSISEFLAGHLDRMIADAAARHSTRLAWMVVAIDAVVCPALIVGARSIFGGPPTPSV